jgi:hypothetical protein
VLLGCGQAAKQPPVADALATAASWTASEQPRETRLTTSATRHVQFAGEVGRPHCALPTVEYHIPPAKG